MINPPKIILLMLYFIAVFVIFVVETEKLVRSRGEEKLFKKLIC